MPHLNLEYTANIGAALDVPEALREVNARLLATGIIDSPEQMKSRAIPLTDFRVGHADAGEAFIHARMHIMAGRTVAQRQLLGQQAVEGIQAALRPVSGLRIQITVEINEMLADTYQKRVIEG